MIVIAAGVLMSAGAAQADISISLACNVVTEIENNVSADIELSSLQAEPMWDIGVAWPRLEVSSELRATDKTGNGLVWQWHVGPQGAVKERGVPLTSYFNLYHVSPFEMATAWTVKTLQSPVSLHGTKLSMQTQEKNDDLDTLAGESLPAVSTTVLLATLSGQALLLKRRR